MAVTDVEEYLMETQEIISEAYQTALAEVEKDMGMTPGALGTSSLSGGKMLRPMLTLLTNQACGGKVVDALEFGVALQLVHSGSLTHDDVLDQDSYRRGLPSLHNLMSIGAAILTGDATMSKAIVIMSKYGPKVVAISARCLYAVCAGAVREVELARPLFDEGVYFDVIGKKTAVLLATCSHVGAISAGAMPQVEEAARQYGFNLGLHFQVVDDLVDLLASVKEKKPVGDLKERKLTLPTYLAYGHIPTSEELASPPIFGFQRVLGRLRGLEAQAIQFAREMPVADYANILVELPGFLMKKMLEEKQVLELWETLTAVPELATEEVKVPAEP